MAVMRLVFVLTLVSSPSMAFGGAVEEANAAVDRWAAAFSANDAAGVVGLFTRPTPCSWAQSARRLRKARTQFERTSHGSPEAATQSRSASGERLSWATLRW